MSGIWHLSMPAVYCTETVEIEGYTSEWKKCESLKSTNYGTYPYV